MKTIQKKIIITTIVIITIPIITFFLIKEKPQQYFDPQNPKNIYTITADNNYFYVSFDSNGVDNQKSIKSIICSTSVDLHQFLDKEVKLQGKFINTTFDKVLCPIDDCHRSSSRNSLQALEITDISLVE